MQIHGVKHVGRAGGNVSVQILADALLPALHVVVLRLQRQLLFNRSDAGRGHGAGLLDVGARRIQSRACRDGVAADSGHLIDDNHAAARAQNLDSRGHARAARADDDDVSIPGFQLLGSLLGLNSLGDIRLGSAGSQPRSLHNLDQAVAGEGAARNGIHRNGLILDDRCRDLGKRRIGDAGSLAVGEHLNGGQLAALDGGGHLDLASEALAHALEGLSHRRRAQHGQNHHKTNDALHSFSSF